MLLHAAGQPAKKALPQDAKMVSAVLLSGQTVFALEDGDKWIFPAALVRDRMGAPAMQPLLESFLRAEFMSCPGTEKLLYKSYAIRKEYAAVYHAFLTRHAAEGAALVVATPAAQDAIKAERLPLDPVLLGGDRIP